MDATGLLDWLNATCPDLVLLDWELLDLTPEVLPVLRERHPSLRVIAISGQPEARLAALAAGGERLRRQGRPARTAAGRGARMPTY